jgi:hypothetical protein
MTRHSLSKKLDARPLLDNTGTPGKRLWPKKRAGPGCHQDEDRRLSLGKTRKEAREVERMDYLEFIARVTSHIPDKGQVTARYYDLYSNAKL